MRDLLAAVQQLRAKFEQYKVEHHDCVTTALDESAKVHDEIEARRDGLEAEVARLRTEKEALQETTKRLNRRCQLAEAAANLKVEEWDKRSKRAGRAYVFELGKQAGKEAAEAQLAALKNAD